MVSPYILLKCPLVYDKILKNNVDAVTPIYSHLTGRPTTSRIVYYNNIGRLVLCPELRSGTGVVFGLGISSGVMVVFTVGDVVVMVSFSEIWGLQLQMTFFFSGCSLKGPDHRNGL